MLEKAAKEAKTVRRTSFKDGSPQKEAMEQAIACWKAKEGPWWPAGPDPSMRAYCQHVEREASCGAIIPGTIRKYLYKAPKVVLGEKTRGRKAHLSKQQEGAAIDTLVLHGRLNDGKTRAQALELIQRLQPSLSSKQAAQALRTTTEKAVNAGKLKSKRVATQATTTKRAVRTAITVESQWRWYRLVDGVDAEHRLLNEEDNTGVKFADVEEFFKVCVGVGVCVW
jgi:hypothetical protein